MITLDYSPRSTVAMCSCGWRDVFSSRAAALRAAADHEEVHNAKRAAHIRERHARVVANAAKSR